MSDIRRHPPVPGSPPGVDADAEEAPTGVIGRITGDWPAPDGGPARREPPATGAPVREPHADQPGVPVHGRHEGGLPGSAPEDGPGLPVRGRHEDGRPGEATPQAQAPAGGAAPLGHATYERQPLPVRTPRRPGAARLGAPPESAPSPRDSTTSPPGGGRPVLAGDRTGREGGLRRPARTPPRPSPATSPPSPHRPSAAAKPMSSGRRRLPPAHRPPSPLRPSAAPRPAPTCP